MTTLLCMQIASYSAKAISDEHNLPHVLEFSSRLVSLEDIVALAAAVLASVSEEINIR